MLRRLRLKFVCINMVMVTLMLAVIFGMVLHFTKVSLEQESLRMMRSAVTAAWGPGRPGEPWSEVRLPYFILQLDGQGELVAASGGYYDLSDRELLSDLVRQTQADQRQSGILSEYHLRFYRGHTPRGELLVFADLSSEQTTMQNLLRTCLGIGALSFLAFLVLSLFLARWAVRPVERAWEQQRQFVADASHELKTPLTVITTNAELLQEGGGTPQRQAQCAGHILTMSRQMRGLVESLLSQARVDAGEAAGALAPVELGVLAANAALPFEALLFERGLTLELHLEEGLWVRGNADQLRQVVEILLDNAWKYASPPGSVTVRLTGSGRGGCLLTVSDLGQPLSTEDLTRIFERFYRADPARSMNQSYGLGLSIAEGIVRAHRGKIWAKSEGGLNSFLVYLPLTAAP